ATYAFPTQEDYIPQEGTALEQLETLEIKGRAPRTGYSREEFGNGWLDPDGNGCDIRNDILQRDLGQAFLRVDYCQVLSVVLDDPLNATKIEFSRGPETSMEGQIYHIVALSDAWKKGAHELSQEHRQRIANDPYNLLAVDGTATQQKS